MPSATAKRKSTRAKVQAYRTRMRERGFRLVQMWLPDTRSPAYRAKARRQCLAIAKSPQEKDDLAFVESLFSLNDE